MSVKTVYNCDVKGCDQKVTFDSAMDTKFNPPGWTLLLVQEGPAAGKKKLICPAHQPEFKAEPAPAPAPNP